MARGNVLKKSYDVVDDVPTGLCRFKVQTSPVTELTQDMRLIVGADVWDRLPTIGKYLLCHGEMQKVGDEVAGETAEDAVDIIGAMIGLIDAGDFYKPSKGRQPTAPGVVYEALLRIYERERPEIVNDEFKARLLAKYTGKNSTEAREKALERHDVKTEVATIKAERAAKRAEAMKAQAAKADQPSLDDLAA